MIVERRRAMGMTDVIPLKDQLFLVQLFAVPYIPDQIGFGRYYEAICEIILEDGNSVRDQCVIHRPSSRRNVVGVRTTDWLVLLLKTELSVKQLSDAAISVARYGAELSEKEAVAWRTLERQRGN